MKGLQALKDKLMLPLKIAGAIGATATLSCCYGPPPHYGYMPDENELLRSREYNETILASCLDEQKLTCDCSDLQDK